MSKSVEITAEVTGYGETRDAKRPFARVEISHTGPDGTLYEGTLAVMAARGWRDRKPASAPAPKGKGKAEASATGADPAVIAALAGNPAALAAYLAAVS